MARKWNTKWRRNFLGELRRAAEDEVVSWLCQPTQVKLARSTEEKVNGALQEYLYSREPETQAQQLQEILLEVASCAREFKNLTLNECALMALNRLGLHEEESE